MPKPGNVPASPGAPATRSTGRTTKEYRISLVTPLFGGGVDPGQPDETLPIRATSIRGHLQFWWRATQGAALTTSEELFARHAQVWGTTEKASPVEVSVRSVSATDPKPCARYLPGKNSSRLQLRWESLFDSRNRELSYVLFPFQGEPSENRRTVKKEPGRFIESASFTLVLRFPEALRPDVEAAVKAWVNFGGLGARTRRGCGALLCKELAPKAIDNFQRWLSAYSRNGQSQSRQWPTMPVDVLVENRPTSPLEAWKKVAGLLQTFRQGVGIARNPGSQGRPGRSHYPEPETIRRATGLRAARHPRLTHIPQDAFPRAEFGLPIVFHFQDQGEPPNTVLYPSNARYADACDRMASPLILKPLSLADGKAVPLVARLATPPITGVVLKQGDKQLELPETTVVRDSRLAAYRDSPLAGSSSGSALEAFLLHVRNNGFREIAR